MRLPLDGALVVIYKQSQADPFARGQEQLEAPVVIVEQGDDLLWADAIERQVDQSLCGGRETGNLVFPTDRHHDPFPVAGHVDAVDVAGIGGNHSSFFQ